MIGMNVDAMVVRAGGEEAARFRPTDNVRRCSAKAIHSGALPEGVDASIMTFQLIYNVKIVNPLAVAVYRADVRAFVALLTDLPLEQAIVNCVLHVGRRRSLPAAAAARWKATSQSSGEADRAEVGLSGNGYANVKMIGKVQSGGTRCKFDGLCVSISALSR